ncbi:MAG: 6-bladed beta-propeller [Oscillospiraceae bacterium]|jgi:WD40 repeat protein|nr:6-bladed beta-propeller [Oscillospiraceae bacterium]
MQENIDFLGNINSICFLDDNHIVVSTKENSSIFIYDETGKQILHIARQGNGPFEYLNPAIVRCDKERRLIYVWCNYTSKMVIFDEKGTPVNEFRISRSIDNFQLYQDYILFYLSTGDIHRDVIGVYDMISSTFIFTYGTASEEHNLLSLNETSGGITILNESLLYAYADKPEFFLLNLSYFDSNIQTKSYKALNTTDFKAQPLNGIKSIYLINYQRNKALEYIRSNSVINGLFTIDDHVVLKAKAGTLEVQNEIITKYERYDVFYVFDKDLNYLFHSENTFLVTELFVPDRLFASNGKDLYFIALNNTTDETKQYSLNRIIFDKNDPKDD